MLHKINILLAFLLLKGQISVVSIFVGPSDFGISLGGPVTGSRRLKGKNGHKLAKKVIDLIGVILAVLLLTREIGIIGVFVAPRRYTIIVSGPIFGHTEAETDWDTVNQWLGHVQKLAGRRNIP